MTNVETRNFKMVATIQPQDCFTFDVTFSKCTESYAAKSRAGNAADEYIISPRIADHAVLNGIGKMRTFPPVT